MNASVHVEGDCGHLHLLIYWIQCLLFFRAPALREAHLPPHIRSIVTCTYIHKQQGADPCTPMSNMCNLTSDAGI